MAIRSVTDIIQSAIDFIFGKKPTASTAEGSVIRDVVIEAPAQEFALVYNTLDHTQKLHTVVYAADLTEEELDDLAQNYALIRLSGNQATGTITFRIRVYSTSSSVITVPVGTVVATVGNDITAQTSFLTTSSVVFQPALAPTYFNPVSGFYEQSATIVAQEIGVASKVPAGTITQLISSVSGIDSIANYTATTGGTDKEDNVAFGKRIQTALAGNSIGTKPGIEKLVRENSNVVDVIVVTPNNPEMLRSEFGGEVDIYVIGEVLTTTTDTVLYTTTGSQSFVLTHQPVRSVASVTGIAGGVPYSFLPGVDFSFVPDTTILFNGSVLLRSKILFDIGGTNPDDSTNFDASYVYNALIPTLQATLDTETNNTVASQWLVKEASEAEIDVTVDISIFPGNTSATVLNAVRTALTDYIDPLGLGQNIDRSDIVNVIEEVSGVDQVDLSSLVLAKNGVPIPSTQQRLSIARTEYARTQTLTITAI